MNKAHLLQKLKDHISYIREKITAARKRVEEHNTKTYLEVKRLSREDQVVYWNIKAQSDKRLEELALLHGTPYFMKCTLKFDEYKEPKEYYFAKFQLSEEAVYSWVAPVASIRFEQPGDVSYKLPNGKMRTAKLLEKKQYMIVDGHPVFFSHEAIDSPRELIYQEHFSTRKTGFMLPEIVAQMEKAQDQVIRAHHKGSMVIAGPAGSGKTTLAFHRVAYLVQAPDTQALYSERSIIIFVQDNGTKEYFSHLLPELGIKGVNITTFSEWAFKLLGFDEYIYSIRYGTSEEKDMYEYEKLKILRSKPDVNFNARPYTALNALYIEHLSDRSKKIFERQKKEKKLDRFDVTLLLMAYKEKYGKLKSKQDKIEALYSLALVDEFQNYLPEQLMLFKECLDKDTQSMVYVGDMAQQIHLGTIRTWKDINEDIIGERNIVLNKVYRNTKNILEYIQQLGYTVSIPEGIKEGPDVAEINAQNTAEEIAYINDVLKNGKEGSLGILAPTHDYLEAFRKAFSDNDQIHILSMSEAQGVEFDIVCIVGITKENISVSHISSMEESDHYEERMRIKKDLLYVALTRAISELHVMGNNTLQNIISQH